MAVQLMVDLLMKNHRYKAMTTLLLRCKRMKVESLSMKEEKDQEERI